MDSPSVILTRAADLIRDTAAAATPGPWIWYQMNWPPSMHDGRWVSLLNPAVAPALEAWLRAAATAAEDYEYWIVVPDWCRAAGDFAVAVLGLVDTPNREEAK